MMVSSSSSRGCGKAEGEIVLPRASKRERESERVEWVDENYDDGDDDIIIIC